MATARKHLVCIEETPYYLVTSRCVRRAYLCGIDRWSGKSYEHRRGWIEDRIRVLSSIFSMDVCAYAVMSNHYHLIVRLDPKTSRRWSDEEVLTRWTTLFRGPLLLQRYRRGEPLTDIERETLKSMIAVYRARLSCLSWFMKCLNEPIARRANAEDCCTGHFWEARFHSQALLSEPALIRAMVYVDLNPVRAKLAKTPENSAHTSIRARLRGQKTHRRISRSVRKMLRRGELQHFPLPIRPLLPFSNNSRAASQKPTLPVTQRDYLRLLDLTGRLSDPTKRGQIDALLLPILERLGTTPKKWSANTTDNSRKSIALKQA